MADKTNLTSVKQTMLNELKNGLKVVNDIDVENGVNSFFMKGGYNANKSYEDNKKSCIQYLAIKKAYKK
jgi:hypothetical protein